MQPIWAPMVESTNESEMFVLCEYPGCQAESVHPLRNKQGTLDKHARRHHPKKEDQIWSRPSPSSNLHCNRCNECFQKAESHRFATQCRDYGFHLCYTPAKCKYLPLTVSRHLPYLTFTVSGEHRSGHGIKMTIAQWASTLGKSIWYHWNRHSLLSSMISN